ncbi:hypothetical protein [Methylocaldum sp.]|uniref:phage adaptor protein n=1 Tax=Methylocaldum sp. TaxID=1969727 RepID=UPI002D5B98EB|nr:hypothetical protein [Methylocaldum sp.]HYE38153.1 hypothetical protein [Methylocaldum sp.]
MTRDQVVALLVQRLNNRTDLETRIISEMQLAQSVRLEQNGEFYPWFLVTEYATEMAEIGEPRIPAPDDFLMELEENGLWVEDAEGNWKLLTKGDEDDLQVALGNCTGLPQAYAFSGEHFTLFPTPNENYNIRMRYNAAQPLPTTNIENAWLKYAPDLVMGEVGEAVAAIHMQNPTLAAEFTKAKVAAWARLRLVHESRSHTNREYSMGGD